MCILYIWSFVMVQARKLYLKLNFATKQYLYLSNILTYITNLPWIIFLKISEQKVLIFLNLIYFYLVKLVVLIHKETFSTKSLRFILILRELRKEVLNKKIKVFIKLYVTQQNNRFTYKMLCKIIKKVTNNLLFFSCDVM